MKRNSYSIIAHFNFGFFLLIFRIANLSSLFHFNPVIRSQLNFCVFVFSWFCSCFALLRNGVQQSDWKKKMSIGTQTVTIEDQCVVDANDDAVHDVVHCSWPLPILHRPHQFRPYHCHRHRRHRDRRHRPNCRYNWLWDAVEHLWEVMAVVVSVVCHRHYLCHNANYPINYCHFANVGD